MIRKAAAKRDESALLALKIIARSVRKAIGGFAWLRIDVSLESLVNESGADGVCRISASDSKTATFAPLAKEDIVVALHVKRMVQAGI